MARPLVLALVLPTRLAVDAADVPREMHEFASAGLVTLVSAPVAGRSVAEALQHPPSPGGDAAPPEVGDLGALPTDAAELSAALRAHARALVVATVPDTPDGLAAAANLASVALGEVEEASPWTSAVAGFAPLWLVLVSPLPAPMAAPATAWPCPDRPVSAFAAAFCKGRTRRDSVARLARDSLAVCGGGVVTAGELMLEAAAALLLVPKYGS
jgi:hypothetical protein